MKGTTAGNWVALLHHPSGTQEWLALEDGNQEVWQGILHDDPPLAQPGLIVYSLLSGRNAGFGDRANAGIGDPTRFAGRWQPVILVGVPLCCLGGTVPTSAA